MSSCRKHTLLQQHPASLYTPNPHIIQLETWLTLVRWREPKEQIISRELWDSWSVWLRVKTAVIVRTPAGLQGLVLGRVTRAPKRLQLWRYATELCAPHQTTTSHLWYSVNKTEKVARIQSRNIHSWRHRLFFSNLVWMATIMQPCAFPPLSMNILELKPSAWWEKTWTRQRLRADVGARSNFKSKHLIAFGSGMRGKLFSFHVSGARPWCQCTPAVNQGLIYAWQQLWMLNEDPLQVHAHTHLHTAIHTPGLLSAPPVTLIRVWGNLAPEEIRFLSSLDATRRQTTPHSGAFKVTAQCWTWTDQQIPLYFWMESFIPAAVNSVCVTATMWFGTPTYWFHQRILISWQITFNS